MLINFRMAMGLIVILAILASKSALAQTNDAVDLNAFQGVWHEVARSPNLFQRNCQSTTAEYRILSNGQVQVVNRCQTRQGRCRAITGTACSTNPPQNNRLIVSLNAPFARRAQNRGRVNYQIHYVSPDYQTAVVGTPGGRLVWILSRSPCVGDQDMRNLKQIASHAGYNVTNLVTLPHTH